MDHNQAETPEVAACESEAPETTTCESDTPAETEVLETWSRTEEPGNWFRFHWTGGDSLFYSPENAMISHNAESWG